MSETLWNKKGGRSVVFQNPHHCLPLKYNHFFVEWRVAFVFCILQNGEFPLYFVFCMLQNGEFHLYFVFCISQKGSSICILYFVFRRMGSSICQASTLETSTRTTHLRWDGIFMEPQTKFLF